MTEFDNPVTIGTLYYCGGFPNYGGIQAIVRARSERQASKAAADPYYGRPYARPATQDEIEWHLGFGGKIIEAI